MRILQRVLVRPELGIVLVILALAVALTLLAGSHVDRVSGQTVNSFLNASTLIQVATDTSFFAIMAVGATMVIVSGGIDLSVGSIYALAGIALAVSLKGAPPTAETVALGLAVAAGVGLLCGLLNGVMVRGLDVHPFIITLGTMWIYRGVAFAFSGGQSLLVPEELTAFLKSGLGLTAGLHPVPLIATLLIGIVGSVYLSRTVRGRQIFAIGGNPEASRYAGVPLGRTTVGVYCLSGLAAGFAAFLGCSYYGSASSADATGYELYVIASAVVGGASLSGGRGSALGAVLGALLIVLMRQSIRTLHLDQNYEWIIIGTAIIVAVVLDRVSSKLAARRVERGLGMMTGD